MSIEVEDYETNNTTWREEFEKAYVDWVDLELIAALLKSIDSSIRFLCKAVQDESRWPSRINKSLRTVSYPRIRDVADFLGIPPWFLFNHKEKNSKIQELFDNINSALKPIELPHFSEYEIEIFHDFLEELEKRVRSTEDFQFLSAKLQDIQMNRNYHHVISGNWKAVFSFFKDIYRDFAGGATFWYRDPDGILNGNLRVIYNTDPTNKRRTIKAGWLSINTESQSGKRSATIDKFINTVIADMEWIFDQQPWIFNIESTKNNTMLLTWHTSRTSNEHFDLVSSLINRQLPEANFSMNIGEKYDGIASALLQSSNPFEEFIQIIKSDVQTTQKSKATRRKNSLQLLLDKGIINNGDHISLIPSSKTQYQFNNELISKATIILENDKPAVRWSYDNNVYSISRLTQIILIQIAQQIHLSNYHLNGTKYWLLNGTDKSLYAMAEDSLKWHQSPDLLAQIEENTLTT
ncbi:hypothetical protein [Paenibacillus thalictri]|uniref:Uncharacterized protein n=1 Tax=Paenibacillus thalictri TaxID=2527873 RepID=A0A4Q9DCR5_9BACL|nr:hypothetical protein [Paenibacillus thalictri]TBL68365.1 hypothetical protein EYB31_38280 [Paenibacillus thalictri]